MGLGQVVGGVLQLLVDGGGWEESVGWAGASGRMLLALLLPLECKLYEGRSGVWLAPHGSQCWRLSTNRG